MSECLQMTGNCSAVGKFREMLSQPVISDQPPWTFGELLLAVFWMADIDGSIRGVSGSTDAARRGHWGRFITGAYM